MASISQSRVFKALLPSLGQSRRAINDDRVGSKAAHVDRPCQHPSLKHLGDEPEWVVWVLVVAAMLPLRQLDFLARQLLVWDFAENVSEDVETRSPLVVGVRDIPRRPGGIAGDKHLVACPRVIEPAGV